MKKTLCTAAVFAGLFAVGSLFAGEPSPAPTPQPLPPDFPPPPPLAATGSPAGSAPAARPSLTPAIPFNAANKECAKKIYRLIKEIQETEFNPETNLASISKLQDTIVQTDFNGIPLLHDYIQASLTLNTLRSKDIKVQRGDTGKSNKENGNKTGGKAGAGFFTLSAGGEVEKSNVQKNETQSSNDVSISSQNDPAVLDKTRQQQATSYGLLLNELKRLGFLRPIDPRDIYGKWRWKCREDSATYEFDFREEGILYVRLITDNPASRMGRFANKGRGEWKLDYRSLSLEMNDVNLAGFWKQHPLIFFTDREVVSIDGEKMLLATDEDNELRKIVAKK